MDPKVQSSILGVAEGRITSIKTNRIGHLDETYVRAMYGRPLFYSKVRKQTNELWKDITMLIRTPQYARGPNPMRSTHLGLTVRP